MTPTVWANCATSLDGKLATVERRQTRLSGPDDMARVHRLRNAVDAIVVGIGTMLADDPKLTVKARYLEDDEPRRPWKVILDSGCRTPPGCEAMRTPGPVLVACAGEAGTVDGAEVEVLGKERVEIDRLLDALSDRGVERVLVEGGGEVLWSFLDGGHVDRLTVYVAPVVLGGRDAPTVADGPGVASIDGATRLALEGVDRLDDGVVLTWTG